MNCALSRLLGVRSKREFGPCSMTTQRLGPHCRRAGGAYESATFLKLTEGRPNWTMEWPTDDQLAKAAFERVVRSVQTQIELE